MKKGFYINTIGIIVLAISLFIVIMTLFNKPNEDSLRNNNKTNIMKTHDHNIDEMTDECPDNKLDLSRRKK